MNNQVRRSIQTIRRTIHFAVNHAFENELAATLLAKLQAYLSTLESIALMQARGHGAMLGAAGNRQSIADGLRSLMRNLAKIARVLDPAEFPTVASTMRTANLKVYEALIARARSFIKVATPIQAVFIAYGAPADFLSQLESRIAALTTAGNQKNSGKDEWIGGTAGLKFTTREAIRALRKLQVILTNLYQHDPEVAAGWKAATHIERAAKSPEARAGASVPRAPLEPASVKNSPVLQGPPTRETQTFAGREPQFQAPIPPPMACLSSRWLEYETALGAAK